MKLDHISVSQLGMFSRCEYQWYQRYVLRKRIPPSGAMAFGIAVDEAVNLDMGQKIETGRNLKRRILKRDAEIIRQLPDSMTFFSF